MSFSYFVQPALMVWTIPLILMLAAVAVLRSGDTGLEAEEGGVARGRRQKRGEC